MLENVLERCGLRLAVPGIHPAEHLRRHLLLSPRVHRPRETLRDLQVVHGVVQLFEPLPELGRRHPHDVPQHDLHVPVRLELPRALDVVEELARALALARRREPGAARDVEHELVRRLAAPLDGGGERDLVAVAREAEGEKVEQRLPAVLVASEDGLGAEGPELAKRRGVVEDADEGQVVV